MERSAIRATGSPESASARREIGLVLLEELLLGDLLFGHIGELNDEVDHLLLVDRRPHGGERIRVLLIVVPHFPLAARILAHPLHQGPRNLLFVTLDTA